MKTNKQKNKILEWKKIPVSDVFTFVKSYAFSRDQLVNGLLNNGLVGNIHYGDIHATYKTPSIDISKTEIPILKSDGNFFHDDDYLKDGDLIMADASEDYEGVGVTVSIHGIGNKKVIGGLHTFVLRDNKNLTNEYFRQYIFRNPVIRNQLQKIANGVSVYGISKTAVSKIQLPIPPLLEQNRIVAILKTWDKVIEKLSKKIEIKKQIKKGLMQNLLTGKKRLKGFSDKWNINKLGELLVGAGSRNKKLTYSRVLSVTNKSGFILPEEQFARVVASENLSNYKVIFRGDFAYNPSRINVGSISRLDKFDNGVLSPMYIVFKTNNKIDSDFFYHWLNTSEANGRIRSCASGSVRESVDFKSFCSIKLRVPSIKEQQEITKILNVAELEIRFLEDKLSIFKDQKRYLLNNLIAGIIRTPKNLKIIKS